MQITSTLSAMLQIKDGKIGGEEQKLINARDLHKFLEVETAFKDWIQRRLEKYGFELDQDFSSFLSESNGGRPKKEIILTLDTAKEISMVENNEKGREARKYFLQVEKAYRKTQVAQIQIPQNYIEALEAFTAAEKEKLKLEIKFKEIEPNLLLADTFLKNGANEMTFSDWAHGLGNGLGRNTVFKILRKKGFLGLLNKPMQSQVDNNRFSVSYGSFEKIKGSGNFESFTKTLITKKGMMFFSKPKLLDWKRELEAKAKQPQIEQSKEVEEKVETILGKFTNLFK